MIDINMETIEIIFPDIRRVLGNFNDHKIIVIEPYSIISKTGEYRLGRANSRMYEVFIIFRPSTIIMYGDCGSWILRQDGIDLPWLRGAIRDPNYLLEKTTNERCKGYDSEKTKKYAKECIGEMAGSELLKQEKPVLDTLIAEFESVDWENENSAYDFFHDVLEDSNPEESLRYSWDASNGDWTWALLYTFLNMLEGD